MTEFRCISVGEAPKRAQHLYRWLYGRGRLIRSLEEAMADSPNSGGGGAGRSSAQALSKSFKDKVRGGSEGCGMTQILTLWGLFKTFGVSSP